MGQQKQETTCTCWTIDDSTSYIKIATTICNDPTCMQTYLRKLGGEVGLKGMWLWFTTKWDISTWTIDFGSRLSWETESSSQKIWITAASDGFFEDRISCELDTFHKPSDAWGYHHGSMELRFMLTKSAYSEMMMNTITMTQPITLSNIINSTANRNHDCYYDW